MQSEAIKIVEHTKKAYIDIYTVLVEIGGDDAFKGMLDLNELVDWCYALKKCSERLDEMRKTLDKKVRLLESLVCVLWVKADNPDPIRTEYTTATPRIKMMSEAPSKKRDEEAYNKVLQYFGATQEAIDTDALRPHWPGLVECCTRLAEQGKPFPAGIDPEKMYPIYSVMTRQIKNLFEENGS